MDNKPYVSYSKYYKPKDETKQILGYWGYTLKSRDKHKHIDYRKFYNASK